MSERNVIRVLLADDHPVFLDGIRAMIELDPGMSVAAQAGDGVEAVRQFRSSLPDVALLDLQMPRMSGLEAAVEIRKFDCRARIIILTTYSGDVQATKALKAGALGYLLKTSPREELIRTLRTVATGNRSICSEIASNIASNVSADELSNREVEILQAAAKGNSNKCIAGMLGITENTAKGHMRSIMAKLRACDRTHAVMIALQRGYLDA